MDGFQVLKQMLVLIHPLLNNQRPPTKAPTYLDTGDLHLYEQRLRNFYLLHKIYGRSDYSELDMSRQFLEGLDGDEYDAERTRLMAIIDGVELNNTGFQPKHRLDCLASTIMNMKNKHNSSKVQINAFSKARLYQKEISTTHLLHVGITLIIGKTLTIYTVVQDFSSRLHTSRINIKNIRIDLPPLPNFPKDNALRAKYMDIM